MKETWGNEGGDHLRNEVKLSDTDRPLRGREKSGEHNLLLKPIITRGRKKVGQKGRKGPQGVLCVPSLLICREKAASTLKK